ncbi:hypothetical protein OPV22_023990 [Ensete ventricosum]|uniref:Uncharacterized protein n=1 Tax=Ensete ventricosum TaxID=4639 RepID=A0AAV8QT97_ENSVE|nr:hypothetical protein OPV22_023990 [Ensete ventricosum]
MNVSAEPFSLPQRQQHACMKHEMISRLVWVAEDTNIHAVLVFAFLSFRAWLKAQTILFYLGVHQVSYCSVALGLKQRIDSPPHLSSLCKVQDLLPSCRKGSTYQNIPRSINSCGGPSLLLLWSLNHFCTGISMMDDVLDMLGLQMTMYRRSIP